MIIDVHCHYILTQHRAADATRFSFEPLGRSGVPHLPTDCDACISRRLARWRFPLFARLLGLAPAHPGEEFDRRAEALYAEQLHASGPIERHVLLAFDAYHAPDGTIPPLAARRRDRGSDMYTSNTLVRQLCEKHPERFLFGASVHPYRADAVDCVTAVFEAGACLLKWLPVQQGIGADDPRTIAVLRRCAALGLPVLVHYNAEMSLPSNDSSLMELAPFLATLRTLRAADEMPPVILAHVATPTPPCGKRVIFEQACAALLDEFADAPLYADVSALTVFGKIGYLREIAARRELHAKLVFGTDFPVPVDRLRVRRDLGREAREILAEPSIPQRAARIMRHVGYPEAVFRQAAELLPNVHYFSDRAAGRSRGQRT